MRSSEPKKIPRIDFQTIEAGTEAQTLRLFKDKKYRALVDLSSAAVNAAASTEDTPRLFMGFQYLGSVPENPDDPVATVTDIKDYLIKDEKGE